MDTTGEGRRDEVDESSQESFPASDPPGWTPVTGEHAEPVDETTKADVPIIHDTAAERFEVRRPDGVAHLAYHRMADGRMVVRHTEVPPVFRGSGVGGRLVQAALDFARESNLPVTLACPFAKAYVERHPSLKAQVQT